MRYAGITIQIEGRRLVLGASLRPQLDLCLVGNPAVFGRNNLSDTLQKARTHTLFIYKYSRKDPAAADPSTS